ncbi:hypothetical protein N7468_006651 [Penicillium chermesinum]|uniref:BZIP domain-containing protein n=1 Tax=Penicillium chermesinum TaxID=63820 RepID=A0A9W9TJT8_9EURO|nr:uncharacterized protein N7468_006651 [Penicillium chermesinum]KAJ5225426.1 hypothetical protein N7468_006651 [Penicillium chermesinum]KAJ6161349.1 hypothetical protein N7470_004745 [Penicillium chermesinum]
MDQDSDRKHSERLARIRENQRKSRAKKQEYIRELEQRLETCKGEAKVDCIKYLLKLQALEAENGCLRELLGTLDVSAETIQEYLRSQARGPGVAADYKIAIPGLVRPAAPNAPRASASRSRSRTNQKSASSGGSNHQVDQIGQAPNDGQTEVNLPYRDTNLETPESGTQSPAGEGLDVADKKEMDTADATLHTKAHDLICQYNTRGIDMDEIWQRLAPAIIVDREGNCCRVQNQALFQILDEISSEI